MYNMIVLSYYYGIITPYSDYTSCTVDMPIYAVLTTNILYYSYHYTHITL